MKKRSVISALFAAFLLMSLLGAACVKNDPPEPTEPISSATDTSPEPDGIDPSVTDTSAESDGTDPSATDSQMADADIDRLFDYVVRSLEQSSIGVLTAEFNPVFAALVKEAESTELFGGYAYLLYDADSIDAFFGAFFSRFTDTEFHVNYEITSGETVPMGTEAQRTEAFSDVLDAFPDYQPPVAEAMRVTEIDMRITAQGGEHWEPVPVRMISMLEDGVWRIAFIGMGSFEAFS